MKRPDGPRIARWAAVCAAGVVILALTLHPSDGGELRSWDACIACGTRGWADVIANVILFAPFGGALALAGLRWRRAVAAGFLLSLAIELAQMAVPGRDSSFGDLLANTAGTGLGAWVVVALPFWWNPPSRRGARLSLAAAVAAAAVFATTGLLLRPAYPDATYHGQWTPELGHLEAYGGSVLAASLGPLPIPPHRVGDTPAFRAALRNGDPIRVRALAGPAPPGLAPLVSVYDSDEREVFLVGPDRDDLVFRYRTRSTAMRLSQPDLRLLGAMRAVSPGAELDVMVVPEPGNTCFSIGGTVSCGHGFSIGSGWSVVYFTGWFPEWLRQLLNLGWVAAFFVPFGFWARRHRESAAGALVLLSSAVVVPPHLGLLATPVPELLVAGAALAAGAWVGLRVRRRGAAVAAAPAAAGPRRSRLVASSPEP